LPNKPMIPAVEVAIVDDSDNIQTDIPPTTITLSLGGIGSSGIDLTGTLTATTSNGVATFDNVQFSASGPDIFLIASSTNYESINSRTFFVSETANIDFDIVYVRYRRDGSQKVNFPDGEQPYTIQDGADLVLRHPDGSEEILVNCDSCSVLDPVISFDGNVVYYAKMNNMQPGRDWRAETANSFIYKMRLSPAQALDYHQEIQLTDLGDGFGTDRYGVNDSNNKLDLHGKIGVRDLAPAPLPDGRILFTSNRRALLNAPGFGSVSDFESGTVSQMVTIDDHDGSTPNRNYTHLGFSNLNHVQHPFVLKDGRILFTNWENAGLKPGYGQATLYTAYPDGTNIEQFLEPHNWAKRVDHFSAQLSGEHVITANYYPRMATFGFGKLVRYPLGIVGPLFDGPNKDSTDTGDPDARNFQRIGAIDFTPHSKGGHCNAPNGRYTTPAGMPLGGLLTAFSFGGVSDDPPCSRGFTDVPDSGIYAFLPSDENDIIEDPSELNLIVNSPDHNEMYPRAVVPYFRIHGIVQPPVEPIDPNYDFFGPTPGNHTLVDGSPFSLVGTSSVRNRESAPIGRNYFNERHGKGRKTTFVIQGTDVGNITPNDLYGIRVLATTQNFYSGGSGRSTIEEDNGLLPDNRQNRVYKNYKSHGENWKILGEFPVVGPDSVRNSDQSIPDPTLDPSLWPGAPAGLGMDDTSFLAKIPANTSFMYQGIDRRGMTLFTEMTWRHAKPGQTSASCGGCHAHSVPGIRFKDKKADDPQYDPWNLVDETPYIETDNQGNPILTILPQGAVDVEFSRDIYPVLKDKCASCHATSGDGPPGPGDPDPQAKFSMFDSTLFDGDSDHTNDSFQSIVRAWYALAKDNTQKHAAGTIPGSSVYWEPQMSRYVRALQARASLLTWQIYNERLDGRTNGDLPDSGSDADLNFDTNVGCTADTVLTNQEKGKITRWIDLGAIIDFKTHTVGSTQYVRDEQRYTDDNHIPVLHVDLYQESGVAKLKVGAYDMESGINLTPSTAVFSGAITASFNLDSRLTFDNTEHVGVVNITELTAANINSISESNPLELTVTLYDNVGNLERVTQYITSIPEK